MIGIEFIQCTTCPNTFRKGQGHLVACCCGNRPICNDCYERLKVEGKLVDRPRLKQNELYEGLRRKMI